MRFRPMKALLVGALAASSLPFLGGVAQAAPVFYNGQITTTVSGNTVTASVPISSSETTSVNRWGACVTSTAEKDDFPLAGVTSFTAWGVKTQTSSRDFAPGTYTITPCVETVPGVWVGTTPQPGVSGTKQFTVSATPTSGTSPATPAGLSGYTTKVWAEEFNGTAVDTSQWTVVDGAENNKVISKAANVRVVNGALETRVMDTDGDKQPNTGAHIVSKLQFLDVGEVVQFRAKFRGSLQEPGTGKLRSWTAVWASGNPWAAPGEIDIAEALSGELTTNYHWGTYPNVTHENYGGVSGFNAADVWGTYAVERTATSYKVYWNGVLVETIAEKDNGGPQNLLVTAGNGSDDEFDWAGGPLQVDYVAVYKKP